VKLYQSDENKSLPDDVPLDCDIDGDEPKSTSKSDPAVLLIGAGDVKVVPCCWDAAADWDENFEPGATLVPAPGGGGSKPAAPEDPAIPTRDRGLADEDTGISVPSAFFFACLHHNKSFL